MYKLIALNFTHKGKMNTRDGGKLENLDYSDCFTLINFVSVIVSVCFLVIFPSHVCVFSIFPSHVCVFSLFSLLMCVFLVFFPYHVCVF